MSVSTTQKFLLAYSGVLTAAVVVFLLSGTTQAARKPHFDEIDVERINIVEPDGTLRMTLSDTARAPGAFFKGKEYPHPDGRKVAGLLFFNDEGTENGGLVFGGSKGKNGEATSSGHLSFDNYEQDQVMVIEGNQDGGNKSSYLRVIDQPDWSLRELAELLDKNKALPAEQQRELIGKFVSDRPPPRERLFLGRREDRSVGLSVKDDAGRDRIVIKVAADGKPTLKFLDADGKVIGQLPAPTQG